MTSCANATWRCEASSRDTRHRRHLANIPATVCSAGSVGQGPEAGRRAPRVPRRFVPPFPPRGLPPAPYSAVPDPLRHPHRRWTAEHRGGAGGEPHTGLRDAGDAAPPWRRAQPRAPAQSRPGSGPRSRARPRAWTRARKRRIPGVTPGPSTFASRRLLPRCRRVCDVVRLSVSGWERSRRDPTSERCFAFSRHLLPAPATPLLQVRPSEHFSLQRVAQSDTHPAQWHAKPRRTAMSSSACSSSSTS